MILKRKVDSDSIEKNVSNRKNISDFHISLLPQWSLQTSARRQLKIHNTTKAELEDGLYETRVLKILLQWKKFFISQGSSIQLDTVLTD